MRNDEEIRVRAEALLADDKIRHRVPPTVVEFLTDLLDLPDPPLLVRVIKDRVEFRHERGCPNQDDFPERGRCDPCGAVAVVSWSRHRDNDGPWIERSQGASDGG